MKNEKRKEERKWKNHCLLGALCLDQLAIAGSLIQLEALMIGCQ